jgi:integrase
VEKLDATGRVLDLHALRHTYGTRLVAAGVDIKTVQTLMRHSTPEMTLGIYVHSDRTRLATAVTQLPMTGTANAVPIESETAKLA